MAIKKNFSACSNHKELGGGAIKYLTSMTQVDYLVPGTIHQAPNEPHEQPQSGKKDAFATAASDFTYRKFLYRLIR